MSSKVQTPDTRRMGTVLGWVAGIFAIMFVASFWFLPWKDMIDSFRSVEIGKAHKQRAAGQLEINALNYDARTLQRLIEDGWMICVVDTYALQPDGSPRDSSNRTIALALAKDVADPPVRFELGSWWQKVSEKNVKGNTLDLMSQDFGKKQGYSWYLWFRPPTEADVAALLAVQAEKAIAAKAPKKPQVQEVQTLPTPIAAASFVPPPIAKAPLFAQGKHWADQLASYGYGNCELKQYTDSRGDYYVAYVPANHILSFTKWGLEPGQYLEIISISGNWNGCSAEGDQKNRVVSARNGWWFLAGYEPDILDGQQKLSDRSSYMALVIGLADQDGNVTVYSPGEGTIGVEFDESQKFLYFGPNEIAEARSPEQNTGSATVKFRIRDSGDAAWG